MALESIGTKNTISYADVAKTNTNTNVNTSREAKAQLLPQQQETSADAPKKTVAQAGAEKKDYDPKAIVKNEEETSRKMKNAIDQVNQKMKPTKTKCEFSYHEETKRVSIKVIDEDTDEVIREIPPEKTLEMISKMWELAGLMVDEKR